MKYCIVLGRGIEGVGVTKCAIEASKSFEAPIYATDDKKWSRRKAHDYMIREFTIANTTVAQNLVDEINKTFDVVLFFSVPSTKHPEKCQENFQHFINTIDKPKILLQFDHKMASIKRNSNFALTCERMDLLLTHSLENDFSKFIKEQTKVETPLKKMTLGFDFDGHRKKYWNPIEEQNHNVVRWIGRATGWKNPVMMMKFHNADLKQKSFITILEGLEASIGWELMVTDKVDGILYPIQVVNKFRPRKDLGETKEFVYGEEALYMPPYLYPQYNNDDCMNRMSYSAFGSDLYQLPKRMYGNNIENCHGEIVASGTIPIFHKHFGDSCIHRVQGKPFSECKDTGTIFLEEKNFIQSAAIMVKLKNDLIMRNEWREMAFDFWKQHADISIFHQEIEAYSNDLMEKSNATA